MQKQSFTVHTGSNAEGTMMFLEVTDDAVILRATTGAIVERWWYERLVNMTYSPKTRVLCLWRRQDDQVHMHKFYTKKVRLLICKCFLNMSILVSNSVQLFEICNGTSSSSRKS